MALMSKQYSIFLEKAAEALDIPPSKYKQAVARYEAVGAWLESGEYNGQIEGVCIYPQGSFRLGTVTRPYKDHKDQDYDIDLVCEFGSVVAFSNAEETKHLVGNRLKEHERYRQMLDREGKRCWTLNYAEQDGVGFHMDVLPSVLSPTGVSQTTISITSKLDDGYEWCSSDPKGYAEWFKHRNQVAFERDALRQKRSISLNFRDAYASIEDVPDLLVRTPLQRTIQILKRHRDVRFSDRADWKCAPISMIITTIAAHLYRNESDVFQALQNIILSLDSHVPLLHGREVNANFSNQKIIRRLPDGTWYIGNPVNPDENFADRWHEDGNARAKAFFQWVEMLKEDFVSAATSGDAVFKKKMEGLFDNAIANKYLPNSTPKVVPPPVRNVSISAGPKPWRNG